MKLQTQCEWCHRAAISIGEADLGNGEILLSLKCGHMMVSTYGQFEHNSEVLVESQINYSNLVGDKLAWEFQQEGVKFCKKTNFNCLIGDEMGLGKTVQALIAFREFKKQQPNAKCLVIVKSATIWQWNLMTREWFSANTLSSFVIASTTAWIPPAFDVYIVGMDTFARMTTKKIDQWSGKKITVRSVEISKHIADLKIDFLIVDEAQSFKDTSSLRTIGLIGYIYETNIKHKLFLSGTPIKNRADEFFPILNQLDPLRFSSLSSFRAQWLVKDYQGKFSKVQPWREQEFRSLLEKFMIRREVKDVMKDLPEHRQEFPKLKFEDDHWKQFYNAEVGELEKTLLSLEGRKITYNDIRAHLMTMRKIIGLSKVDWAVDFVEEFLESNSEEKIAIGVSHDAVRDLLYTTFKAKNIECLKLSGEDNAESKQAIKNQFINETNTRVLIINILSGGVGMDGLQVANNILVLERQWSSVDEDQFERRFSRYGQTRGTIATYPEVSGTIDEWFNALVAKKRHVFEKTVGNNWDLLDDGYMLEALLSQLTQKYL